MPAQPSPQVDQPESQLIVTDSRPLGLALHQALARLGHNGPHDNIVSLDHALQAAQAHRDVVQRVLVALGPDASRGLDVVRVIREITSVPLFVVGPREAGLILDAVHAGADDFIEDTQPLDDNLAKALSRHKSGGKASSEEGQLICVASARGGCGGSLVSVNLAAALAQRTKRAALCDFDLENGVCDALFNIKPKHTILDLGRCLEKLDRDAVERALIAHSSGVHLLPAPSQPFDDHIQTAELCQRVVCTIRQMFPVVVVDIPRLSFGLEANPWLMMCNKFVLVTQLDFNAIRSARRTLEYLDRIGVSEQRIQIVGNRCDQPNGLSIADAERGLNRKIAHVVPDDAKTVNRSINCGTPYILDSPTCRLSKAVSSLAGALLGGGGQPSSTNSKTEEPAHGSANLSGVLYHWGHKLISRRPGTEATTS